MMTKKDQQLIWEASLLKQQILNEFGPSIERDRTDPTPTYDALENILRSAPKDQLKLLSIHVQRIVDSMVHSGNTRNAASFVEELQDIIYNITGEDY
jgi:hypothetical protein